MAQKNAGHIYTVSKLTRKIKHILEDTFDFVWITGEISNLAIPASGHAYFTLKDDRAVISAVIFRNQKSCLKFSLGNGLKVFGLARLTLYEPRGSYQLVFEHIEPAGTGSIQLAYEQLKEKLRAKGFFNDNHKRKIPFLPAKVCLITSRTGAAVKDILQIASRRFPDSRIEIIPVSVQGDSSVQEICQAFTIAQDNSKPEVIILARGGGSIEDLQAFNSEQVAETIFQCTIPVVTGIGHETDFTIADFVADLRAPTPSAAAEIVFPNKSELTDKVASLSLRLEKMMIKKLERMKESVHLLASRLKTPKTVIYHHRLQIEDFQQRLAHAIGHQVSFQRKNCEWLVQSLVANSPEHLTRQYHSRLVLARNRLEQYFNVIFSQMRSRLSHASAELEAASPNKILARGYSITRTLPGRHVIDDADKIKTKDMVEIILSKGRLTAKVEQKHG